MERTRFLTRSDTNQAVQQQKFWIFEVEGLYYVAKTKALITVQLICVFIFAYAKSRFSHDTAHLKQTLISATYAYEKIRFFEYAKTKTHISFAVTAKLISAFVFAT